MITCTSSGRYERMCGFVVYHNWTGFFSSYLLYAVCNASSPATSQNTSAKFYK